MIVHQLNSNVIINKSTRGTKVINIEKSLYKM